jgi:hypothetical protein
MLVVELILRGLHQGTALPLMSSSWKNIVVSTRWDAAFERSLNMDSTRYSHSYEFSQITGKFFTENHCMNTKC